MDEDETSTVNLHCLFYDQNGKQLELKPECSIQCTNCPHIGKFPYEGSPVFIAEVKPITQNPTNHKEIYEGR